MFKNIIKRDGRIVPFEPEKITNAIAKAGKATGEFDYETAKRLTIKVLLLAEELIRDRDPHVEEIQDIVEECLLSSPYRKTAKAYIIYRDQHARMREIARTSGLELVDAYLSKVDWRIKENSNMSFSLQGLNNYISSEISKTYWLHKIYPPEVRDAHINGDLHIHDLNVLAPYTYYGKEVIIAKYKDKILLTSFEKLYEMVKENEILLNQSENAWAKCPKNLFVMDINGWTLVNRIIRKEKNRQMRFIKNRGGKSVIVTEDHPMITKSGEKRACEVTKKDFLFSVNIEKLLKGEKLFFMEKIDLLAEIKNRNRTKFAREKIYFNGVPIENIDLKDYLNNEDGILHTSTISSPRFIPINFDFGYIVGFILAEGYLSYNVLTSRCVSVVQKDIKKLIELNKMAKNTGFFGCINKKDKFFEWRIHNPFLRFIFEEVFAIKPKAKNKTLPIHILYYNLEFIKGLISGIIDGDGSIETCQTVLSVRTASRTMLESLSILLEILGFTPRDRKIEGQGSIRFYNGREIKQNYPIYGLSFRKINGIDLLSEKYQVAKYSSKAWHDESKNEWHRVINNEPVEIPDKFIYDITTETNTLIVNGMWNHNCVGWDLMDLLIRGFGGVTGKVESLPAKHFRSALGQMVNFLYTLQGESAGAQAFSNVDTLLAPFIAYDGLNYKQVKQALQEWVFNLNVPTRVGFQTPFSNITLDLKVPEHLSKQAVIIGGKPHESTYGEFQKEMDMFNKALFEVLSEGDAKGRVFTFPIPTINITKDFDWESPVVDLIMEATAKYGIPYFANYVNSDLRPEDARSMCCRLRLETRELKHRGGGLFGSNPLTGSIGVVTINLPRVGYLSKNDEEFFERLLRFMEIAKTSLEIKRKVLERFTDAGLYPYSRHYLSAVKERTGFYWCNHFSTIGIIGMNEAIANLKSSNGSNRSNGIWTVEGREFALRVMDLMRERLIEFQKESGNLYNLEATPAEGTSYRLAKIDKQKYPDIITQGKEHPYYTNSTWLPVGFTESIHYILDNQDELQSKYTGGTVQHLFLGEKPEPERLKEFVKAVFTKYRLPYISITPTFSICPECGYIEGEHSTCPKCGSDCEVYSRVVGYLRPVSNWNDGKKEEFKDRKYLKVVL